MNNYLVSRLVTYKEFYTPSSENWSRLMKDPHRPHRKAAEFFMIAQALDAAGVLKLGKKGIGFAVGEEPLPALFASFGCEILASDLAPEDPKAWSWKQSAQNCRDVSYLNSRKICDDDQFKKLVSYRAIDMGNLPDDLGKWDFCWSSCSFEHIGTISSGMKFFAESLKLLKPGGIAVHTTELNLTSNTDTIDNNKVTVLFRKRDIEKMRRNAKKLGYDVGKICWDSGDHELDKYVDTPPFQDSPHLKLQLGKFVSTSIILIVRKPE